MDTTFVPVREGTLVDCSGAVGLVDGGRNCVDDDDAMLGHREKSGVVRNSMCAIVEGNCGDVGLL